MDSMMMLSILFSLFFLVPFCDGYAQGCETNVTSYVSEGSNAELTAEDLQIKHTLEFVNTRFGLNETIFQVLDVDLYGLEYLLQIRFDIPSLTRRINVTAHDQHRLTIFLKDIKPTDNGTYLLMVDKSPDICWTLFVIGIEMEIRSQHIAYLAEGTSLRLKGNPASSVVNVLSLNISVVWLFDGLNENETENFYVTGDWMWIPRVTREQDRKNITYRVKHGDDVKEVSLTLNVFYIPPSTCSTSSKMAFAVLGALLTLTILSFICSLVCLCCRVHISKTESFCILCFKKKYTPNPEPNTSSEPAVQEH